jgi:hypothetical protein
VMSGRVDNRERGRLGRWPRRGLLAAGAVALALGMAGGVAAQAAGPVTAGYDPCPTQPSFSWMGRWVAQPVSIPSLTKPGGIAAYEGTIVRPANRLRYRGRRAAVVLQHGLGGSQCALWWAARDLAGHGYVAIVSTAPRGASNIAAFVNAEDATRSDVAFLRSHANPFGPATDGQRIGLAGHSLGSIVVSDVQQDQDPGVRAIVALDNLHRWVLGDPGAAEMTCVGSPAGQVTPRVPALGFAKDSPCSSNPTLSPPDLKEAGWSWWRANRVASMELVMRGFTHGAFATGGTEAQHRQLAHFVEAWLDRWVLGRRPAAARLLSRRVLGQPAASLLSTRFLSGAYLPPRVNTDDYAKCLGTPTRRNCRR